MNNHQEPIAAEQTFPRYDINDFSDVIDRYLGMPKPKPLEISDTSDVVQAKYGEFPDGDIEVKDDAKKLAFINAIGRLTVTPLLKDVGISPRQSLEEKQWEDWSRRYSPQIADRLLDLQRRSDDLVKANPNTNMDPFADEMRKFFAGTLHYEN